MTRQKELEQSKRCREWNIDKWIKVPTYQRIHKKKCMPKVPEQYLGCLSYWCVIDLKIHQGVIDVVCFCYYQ